MNSAADPERLTIFGSFTSSSSYKPILYLSLARLPYSFRTVNLKTGVQRTPEYLAINPKGRVPSLVTDRGILTETPAILVFVAQSHPRARLAPLEDPFAFAQAQAFNSYLCSTVHLSLIHI